MMAGVGKRRRRGPERVCVPVDSGEAELVRDPDRPGGWTLLLDGTAQSYVDLGHPGRLEFDYVRRLGAVLDLVAPAGRAVRALHLGAGALTLPRYVAATRPGSRQRVAEHDEALVELVRSRLPLPRGADLRVRAADAYEAVAESGDSRYDVVVNDVYRGAEMPDRLVTVEFARQVARVLCPGGWYAVNLADGRSLAVTRRQVATLRQEFAEVCLLADPGVLRRRRFGNLLLVAATAGERLPVPRLERAVGRDALPARVLHGEELERFAAGARPVTDEAASGSGTASGPGAASEAEPVSEAGTASGPGTGDPRTPHRW